MGEKFYNRFNPLKILLFSDELQQIADGKIPYPLIWHIYPTNLCPLNCSFCIMARERRNVVSLPRELLLKSVREAAKHAKTVHFSGGGEPTAHPDLLEAITLAKQLGLKVALSTNGFYLTQEILDLVDFPRVSLNAATQEVFCKNTGTDLWNKTIARLKSLKNDGKLGLGFVLTPENQIDLYNFCALAFDLKVRWVHVRPAFIKDRNAEIRSLMPEAARVMAKAQDDFPGLAIYFKVDKFDGYWTLRLYDKCRATPLLAVLKANGRFCVCQDRTDLEFGDYRQQSFEEIWRSQEHQDVLQRIKLEECPRCVETKKNEYIEQIFIKDGFQKFIL